jgi:small GTP-binding protein
MDYVFKIVIVGESGVGKTTMFRQFIDDPKKDETSHLTTIGVDFHHKTIVLEEEEQGGEPRTAKLQLWDTAGQERFNALTKQYFNGTHGCVLVFDLSLPSTLAGLKRWAEPIQDNEVDRLILIGNKSDLQRAVTAEQIDAVKAMLSDLQGRGEPITYLETCSRTGDGVDKVFWQLAHELVAKCEPRLLSDGKAPVSPGRGRAINISETATAAAAAKKKGCC